MKNSLRILALISGLYLSSLAAVEAATNLSSSSDITLPKVKRAVAPPLTNDQMGKEVHMQFKVHSSGRVYGIKTVDQQPDTKSLAHSLKRSLAHWYFEPAYDSEGRPITVEVILPIRITGNGKNNQTLAMSIPSITEQIESRG